MDEVRTPPGAQHSVSLTAITTRTFKRLLGSARFPLHIGMRWYWKDFESMEQWTRSEPHRTWWQNFIRDSGGTGFWHEAYFMRGGMEGVYVDVNRPPLGFQAFARDVPMRGPMFSARQRLQVSGDTPAQPPGMAESDLYQSGASGREGAA